MLPIISMFRNGKELKYRVGQPFKNIDEFVNLVNMFCGTYRNSEGGYLPKAIEADRRVKRLYVEKLARFRKSGFDMERIQREAESVSVMMKKNGTFSRKVKDQLFMRKIVLERILEFEGIHHRTNSSELFEGSMNRSFLFGFE
jgi:hypothetical protein